MNSIVFMVVIPLVAAFISLFLTRQNRILALGVTLFDLVFSLVVLTNGSIPFNVAIGGWKAPFGINFVVTTLSIYFLIFVNLGGLLALTTVKDKKEYYFYTFYYVLLSAVNGMILTGDIFNFFLFVELATFAITALIGYKKDRLSSGASLKYLILSSAASFFTLASIGLIYKTLGTLNFADIASKLGNLNPAALSLIMVLFLGGMFVELEIFPFNLWVPKAYEGSKTSVNLMLNGMLGTAGIYAAIRILLMVFSSNGLSFSGDVNISGILLILATLTIIVGETGALTENNLKKVLAFSTMAQMGMILFGLSLGDSGAIRGALYIALSNFLAKFVLFTISGEFSNAAGTLNYKEMRGIGRKYPLPAIAFTIAALSLMGMPFFAGFWGKLSIVSASAAVGGYSLAGVVIILVASVIEGIYFLRIAYSFFTEGSSSFTGINTRTLIIPAVLAAVIILIGVYPTPVEHVVSSIVDEVLNSADKYINIILSVR